MATIVLRNGWNEAEEYSNVTSVTFLNPEGEEVTFYENGSGGGGSGGGGTGGVGIKADWLQISPYHPSYIKNRPFYIYYDIIVEPSAKNFEVDRYNLYVAELQLEEPILEGKDYIVYWKENGYLCKAKLIDGDLVLGDASLIKEVAQEEDPEPFVGYFVDGVNKLVIGTTEQTSLELVGLFSSEEKIQTIDKKFLPDDIVGLDETALTEYLKENEYTVLEDVNEIFATFEKRFPAKIEEMASQEYVNTAIKEIETTLKDYATTAWVGENFVSIENLEILLEAISETYATKEELKGAKEALEKTLADYKTEVEKTYATKTELADSQADWDVEDENNPAAIKNKPFGIYADLIPNISYSEDSFIRVNNSDGLLVYKLQTGLTLTNTQYEVIWNEEKFICVPDIKTAGAPFLLSMDGSFTTDTFPSGRTTITLRLLDNIYRLDKKFLPKDIATEEYVDDKIGEIEQSNWNETDPNSKAYIANKPEVVQADWKATNSSSMAYIKNKPEVVQADWNVTNTSSMAFIKNKPSVVQSDWNATSGMAFIKNKPTIPDAQVPSDWSEQDSSKVSFIKNKPSIPDPQVNSDWGEEDPTKISFIKNKPNFFSDWNAVDGRTRIVNMPAAFRHSVAADGAEEMLIDTASGWKKQVIERLTMTVTFDDDSVKTYSIVGKEVIE